MAFLQVISHDDDWLHQHAVLAATTVRSELHHMSSFGLDKLAVDYVMKYAYKLRSKSCQ